MYKVSFWKRILLGILAFVLVVGQIPYQALAADSQSTSASVSFKVENTIEGSTPKEDVPFTFVLEAESANAPMPSDNTVIINGAGSASFGAITYTTSGEYDYTIHEVPGEQKGYTYDNSVYHIRVNTGYNTAGEMNVIYSLYKGERSNGKSESITFVNEYLEPKVSVNVPEGNVMRVVDDEGNIVDEWVSTGEPHEIENLEPGKDYTLINVYAPGGNQIAEDILIHVSPGGDTEEITVPTDDKSRTATSTAKVTKSLTIDGKLMTVDDAVFYAALFSDEACTKRVSEIKTLTFKDKSSVTVTFEYLEPGTTYYLSETDASGAPVKSGVLSTGEAYTAAYTQGQKLVAAEDDSTSLVFENQFASMPLNSKLEGKLTIVKKVQNAAGEPKNSNETFYAGIFDDAAYTKLSDSVSENIVALKLSGTSEASAFVGVTMPDSGSRVFYVTEVDKEGKPVASDSTFAYQVIVNDTEVTFSDAVYSAEVTILNREKTQSSEQPAPETPNSETEAKSHKTTKTTKQPTAKTPETKASSTSTGTVTTVKTTATTSSSSSPKTGDTTNVTIWVALLLLAAVGIIGVGVTRRRKHTR
jgi:pilin isopeptide linkage protein/LPXTG-motif cell wall-anchored protein